MGQKLKLGDKEYEVDNLSNQSKKTFKLLQYTSIRIQELNNIQKLLQCAKNSYVESLKKEMISSKSGFMLDED
jgi:hypothetical protein